jgi:hypothetical protein
VTYPEDMLDGLDATPEERLAFYRALGEVEAEEDAGLLDGDGDDGPWHDWAGGYSGDELDRLHEIGEQVDDTYARNARRVGEDIVSAIERRPKDEARLASALSRIQAGTYTEPQFFRGDETVAAAARDPLGRYRAACGPLDEYSRCASKYHAAGCHVITEGAAATSSATAVEAWRDVLSGYTSPSEALGLASPPAPEPGDGTDMWGYVLDSGEPRSYGQLRARMLHEMGESDAPARELDPGLPDVSGIRAALGL